jgi:hypothetical protein
MNLLQVTGKHYVCRLYLRSLKYFLELVHVGAKKKLGGVIHLFIRFVLSMMLI